MVVFHLCRRKEFFEPAVEHCVKSQCRAFKEEGARDCSHAAAFRSCSVWWFPSLSCPSSLSVMSQHQRTYIFKSCCYSMLTQTPAVFTSFIVDLILVALVFYLSSHLTLYQNTQPSSKADHSYHQLLPFCSSTGLTNILPEFDRQCPPLK
jgi:hypothetical protein